MGGDYSQLRQLQADLASAGQTIGQGAQDVLADAQHAGTVAIAAATPGPGLAQFLQGEQGQYAPQHRIRAALDNAVHGLVNMALVKLMRGGP